MVKESSALSSTAHSQRELQILHLLWPALVEQRVTWTIWGGGSLVESSDCTTWAVQPVYSGFIKAII